MSEGMDKGREAFLEEANELLTELESSLLELEESPTDTELIGRVFRAMHTIKGSGAMFGFDDIAAFTHEVETAFDLVRTGKLTVTKELMNLTLMARDHIRAMLDGVAVDESQSLAIINSLRKLTMASEGQTLPHQSPEQGGEAEEDKEQIVTYRIRFIPYQDIFLTGANPILLLDELREMGTCQIIAQTQKLPPLKELDPESCMVFWDIILTTSQRINDIRSVFIFVEDSCELHIDVIDDGSGIEAEKETRLGEILIARGDIHSDELKKVLGRQKKVGEILVDTGLVDKGQVESALAEQQHLKEIRDQRQKQDTAASIRVPSDKLDSLVDLVGELVTVQARLTSTSIQHDDAILSAIAEEVERITWELRDRTMGIRMLPIGTTFSKFKRLVRDLSNNLGKEIMMTTDGAETELDKTVIEKLNDPLVHIIRNSIDHGIELPDVRVAQGKPRHGTVHLTAGHSGANVLIQIEDDGAGLNKEAILAKAVSNGIIAAGADITDKDIFGLIFEPGFSTATAISSVSGRGVGMDVVKKNITALRGTVDVKSQRGMGTTITLKLPLTLAIIDGLLVKIEEDFFVIPLSMVHECVELTRADVDKAHGRHISYVREQIVPYIRLRDRFSLESQTPDIEQIVITEVDGHRVGFAVDYVIGEHQTVIKPLGRLYKNVDGVSGATILGDGSVALILDIPDMVHSMDKKGVPYAE